MLECIFPGMTVVTLSHSNCRLVHVALSLAAQCGTDTLDMRWVSLSSWQEGMGTLATFGCGETDCFVSQVLISRLLPSTVP